MLERVERQGRSSCWEGDWFTSKHSPPPYPGASAVLAHPRTIPSLPSVPVDIVASSVDQIVRFGRVTRPMLGIAFAPEQSAEQLGVRGVLVLDARKGSPADEAGIKGTSRDEYGRWAEAGLGGEVVGGAGSESPLSRGCLVQRAREGW